MKRIHSLLVATAVVGLGLSSCTTDDIEPSTSNGALWEGSLAPAPFENDARLLEMSENLDGYGTVTSIELTSSGLYYVTYDYEYEYPYLYTPADTRADKPASTFALRKHSRANHAAKASTRDWTPYQSVICGDFKVLGNGTYDLEGFGIMTINPDHTISLTMADDGREHVWDVTIADKIPNSDSALNSRLCRTWKLIDGKIEFLNNDREIVYTLNISPSIMEDEYIYEITFSTSGRVYRRDGADEGWYGGGWRWSDNTLQLVEMWSDDPSDGAGIFQTIFKDKDMQVMNPWYFDDPEEARWEFGEIPGSERIPADVRYAREFINMKAMN